MTRLARVWRVAQQRWLHAGGVLLLLASSMPRSACQALRFLHEQSWSVEDGLPQSSVHRVLQSSDGYLWIATEGGVARFDGLSFTVFRRETEPAFASDDVCCLAQDGEGSLWFGTADGVVRLREGRMQHFGEADGLPSASIVALAATRDGGLLVLTTAGLGRWSGSRFVALPMPAMPRLIALEPARDGGAWLLSEDGLAKLRDGRVQAVTLPKPREPAVLAGVAEGPRGELWLRSAKGVVAYANGVEREWRVGRELPGRRVESMTVDRAGRAWVGTNDALVTLDAGSDGVTAIGALNGNAVLDTIEDREGNRWIGTETGGLHLLRQMKFRSEPGLAGKAVTSVVQARDGAVWAGTREDGLRRIRGDTTDEPVKVSELTSPVVLSLAPGERGSVWVGTPDGLNHVEASGAVRRITAADGLPDEFVRSLLAGRDGSVWAGTRRGLAHVTGTRTETVTKADGLGGDLIGTLLETAAKGDVPAGLWISTSGGLSLLSRGAIRTFTARDGLDGQIVTGMAQDEAGGLWVATQTGGLSRYAGGRFMAVRGLALGETIDGIASDGVGYLWVRGARGVRRIAFAALTRCMGSSGPCDLTVERFGVADGMPSEESVAGGAPALWRTTNGEIWIATRRGLAIADAAHLPMNRVPPPVALERFLVDDAAMPVAGAPLAIAFGHARFTIEYAGLSYTVPSKVRYRFQLEGFDREWTNAGARRSATYTNLPPKSYRFRVQAMNNDGVWSEPGAELAFRIVPPFYRRWWFALAMLLLLAGLAVALYRLRLRRLERQFDAVLGERNRIAREIHDTLAQDFVGVSIQLELVSQLLGRTKTEAALAQIERTRRLVRDGLADARQSIWELRANTATDSLPTRLRAAVQRYRTETTTVQLRIGGAYRALGVRVEDEVLRVAQEALSNVDRHAHATEIAIELTYGADALRLAVRDNGHGFPADAGSLPEGHYGVRGMRERAAGMGGRLEIESAPGEGTTVMLQAPIAAATER